MKLYHYTNTDGKTAIEKTKKILQSKKDTRWDDAVYGNGVYLTSIKPTESTTAILGNNWDGIVIPHHMKAKTEWYFEFDSEEGDLEDQVEEVGKNDKRDVWLLRGMDLPCTDKALQRPI